jgi:hypothetical protein
MDRLSVLTRRLLEWALVENEWDYDAHMRHK